MMLCHLFSIDQSVLFQSLGTRISCQFLNIITLQTQQRMPPHFNELAQKLKNTATGRHRKAYMAFKKQLLTMMTQMHPLDIVESGIFQQYQSHVFALTGNCRQSIIRDGEFDGVSFKVVERVSLSLDSRGKHNISKIRRLEEQHKVDLAIWSNIMKNHFENPVKIIVQNSIKDHPPKSSHLQEGDNKTTLAQIFLNAEKQILTRNSPSHIRAILKELNDKFQDQHQTFVSQLQVLQSNNQELNRINQQSNFKILEYIVNQKELQKRILELEEQIKQNFDTFINREDNLKQKQNAFSREFKDKIKWLEEQNKENLKRNGLEDMRERISLESIKRKILYGLDREKSKIDLEKETITIESFRWNQANNLNETGFSQTLSHSIKSFEANTYRESDSN